MKNLVFLTFLISAQSFAMPAAHFDNRPDCAKSRYEQQSELLQKISLMAQLEVDPTGKFIDPRGPISTKGPELGLSKIEIARMRDTCGHVYCGEPVNGEYDDAGSGCLFGSSGRTLLTAKHIIFGFDNHPQAAKCYFRNQASPPRISELDLSQGGSETIGSEPGTPWSKNDLLVIKLKRKINKLKPFPLSKHPMQETQPMILFSSAQAQMPVEVGFNEPVVQQCWAQDVGTLTIGPSFILGDCTSTKNGSGSIGFRRDENGELAINSVLVASGPVDKCIYDPNKNCYSYSLGVNQDVNARIADFSRKSGFEMAKGPTESPLPPAPGQQDL